MAGCQPPTLAPAQVSSLGLVSAGMKLLASSERLIASLAAGWRASAPPPPVRSCRRQCRRHQPPTLRRAAGWRCKASALPPLPVRRQQLRVAAAAAEPLVSAAPRSVVILPGLGNNSKDYAGLVEQLAGRGLHCEVAPVARLDWARNAAGLRQAEYWRGTLQPRPTVDWYLERVAAAVEAAKRATDGAPLTLLAHSAGGWLGRLVRHWWAVRHALRLGCSPRCQPSFPMAYPLVVQ